MKYVLSLLLIASPTNASELEPRTQQHHRTPERELTRAESASLVDRSLPTNLVKPPRLPNIIRDFEQLSQSTRMEYLRNTMPDAVKQEKEKAVWALALVDLVFHDTQKQIAATDSPDRTAYLNALIPCYVEGLNKTYKTVKDPESLTYLIDDLHQVTQLQDLISNQSAENTYQTCYTMAADIVNKRSITKEQAVNLTEFFARLACHEPFYADAHAFTEKLIKKFKGLHLSGTTLTLWESADLINNEQLFKTLNDQPQNKNCLLQ